MLVEGDGWSVAVHMIRSRMGCLDIFRRESDGSVAAVRLSPLRLRYSSWSSRRGIGYEAMVREAFRERRISLKLFLKLLNLVIRSRFSELFFIALLITA